MCCLLGDEKGRPNRKRARGAREDGGVYNTETIDTVDLEVGIDTIFGIVLGAHAASRRGVVAESVILDGLLGIDARCGLDDLVWRIRRARGVEDAHSHGSCFSKSLKIPIAALLEEVEVDERRVTRVGGAQCHGTRLVASLHLDHGPEKVAVRHDLAAEAGEVATELGAGSTEEEDIAVGVLADAGAEPHGQRGAAFAVGTGVVGYPLLQTRVLGRRQGWVEEAVGIWVVLPGDVGADGDAAFVVVLQEVSL